MRPSTVIPLSQAPEGAQGEVVALSGGRQFRERIMGMGLCVGAAIRILRTTGGNFGSAIVATGDTRLAIGHGMAEKIMITLAD